MENKTTLYFAYGSNMNNGQMAHRCPGAKNLGPARLPGWGLRERLHADIDKAQGEIVHGVLWELTDRCLEALDFYEGTPTYYIRRTVEVLIGKARKNTTRAITYEMATNAKVDRAGEPFTNWYAQACADGAWENGVKVDPLYND